MYHPERTNNEYVIQHVKNFKNFINPVNSEDAGFVSFNWVCALYALFALVCSENSIL